MNLSHAYGQPPSAEQAQALLHAAAIDHRPPSELFRWTLDPAAAGDAVSILATHPQAAGGWAEALQAMIDADPRTRDSIWQGVSLALAALIALIESGDAAGFHDALRAHLHRAHGIGEVAAR